MNLFVDIGNTEITLYIEKKDSFSKHKFNSYPNENIIKELDYLLNSLFFAKVIVSSVVPIIYDTIKGYLEKKTNLLYNVNYQVFSNYINFGDLDFKNMGADRVIVDYAALSEYGDNLIIFDLGTAITVDVFSNKKIINGYIFPGLKLLRKALVDGTSLLNTFHFSKLDSKNQCLNTTSQLNDGIIIGIIGTLNQYIKANESHFSKDFKVIITGGILYELFEYVGKDNLSKLIEKEVIYDTALMYKGLSLISKNID